MSRTIDLNADLGEGCPWDEPLLERVTSASVCCGAHAGGPEAMVRTLQLAKGQGVAVGAHPGYHDREGFGRREQVFRNFGHNTLYKLIRTQVDDLARIAAEVGTPLRFLKPHGALYNQAQREGEVAVAVVSVAALFNLPILGQPGGSVETIARNMQVPFIAEGFADRRYLADGRLAPRSEPGAVLEDPDEIRRQVLALVDRGVQTLCVHGDHLGSVELADLILATLRAAGVEPKAFA